MPTEIFFYSTLQSHRFLSNFYWSGFILGGKHWASVEHYFQASKSLDPEVREDIRMCSRPGEAKAMGGGVECRPDWEEAKEGVMLRALRAKFGQNSYFREKLLATGDAVLHEDSPSDGYWGWYKGRGLDRLGVLLMQVREELRGKEDR